MASQKDAKADGGKPRAPPPALNPENCALVQPYRDFVGRGFIRELRVKFTPLGIEVGVTLKSDLLKSGETDETLVAVADAKQRIIDAKLWTPGNRGKEKATTTENARPKKSLIKEDFQDSDEKLAARALAVASANTDTTARGRIGSLKMMIEGVDTFEQWWSEAAPSEKSRLLADKRHHEMFTDEDHIRLDSVLVRCPFRGSVPTPPKEEEEEAPPTKKASPSSSQALVPKKKGGRS